MCLVVLDEYDVLEINLDGICVWLTKKYFARVTRLKFCKDVEDYDKDVI